MSFTARVPEPAFPKWPVNDYYAYNFLHTELNSFQFYNRDVLQGFIQKLKSASSKRVNILHIGDSHVQADAFTGEIRNQMQQAFGHGGRGLVFPYSTARTHAAVDYSTEHTGRWLYAKNVEQKPELPLGVTGVSSRTIDSTASFKLHFRNTILPEFTKLRIFCKRTVNSYDLKIKTKSDEINVDVFTEGTNNNPEVQVVEIDLSRGENDYNFYLQKTDSLQNEFEIYGISIENPADNGVLYHSVGINGAGYYSLLRQDLFASQLHYVNPDLVIIDVGANDFYRGGLNRSEFISNMQRTIAVLRSFKKDLPIVFSCSQDIYRGGYSVPDCGSYSELIKEISKDNNCAFYDWYWVSGGRFSMLKWNNSALSKWDLVHLSSSGYKLKGQLITEAFRNTYNWYESNDSTVELVYNIDSLLNPPIDTTQITETVTVTRYKWVYHKVRKGQTIYKIAAQYGVTVAKIKSWNRLKSNYLRAGQVLKINVAVKEKVKAPASNTDKNPTIDTTNSDTTTVVKPAVEVKPAPKKPAPKPKPPTQKATYHKVKSGETLFSIAKKYKTSTSALMKLNGMKSHNIRAGQIIRVK